ncbi:methyltransferase domain-containing protein [Rhodobacterales bacterium HKCCA1058]|nr:methyltransferase domain-containing protein [Rhodobacterales bacterium HKCCA1058]
MIKADFGCRICASPLENKILNLPMMPLTDDFVSVENSKRLEYLSDINIYVCDNCGIVQNPKDFDHETYYQDYEYSSGHSEFTKRFMDAYAAEAFSAFKKINNRDPNSVLEVGSGDGQQLLSFKNLGVSTLLGVEPSDYLSAIAQKLGIISEKNLFGSDMIDRIPSPIDICISSYTFDHVRQPLDYLEAANSILGHEGILCLEIHDFEKILERTEYCLFEHEHTIYMTGRDISKIIEKAGFTTISINPLRDEITRGNSLIIIAKKSGQPKFDFSKNNYDKSNGFMDLQDRVTATIDRIDNWIRDLPSDSELVGFGAGGRGVMTLSALTQAERFDALFDSNYESGALLSPKTRIEIVGSDDWSKYSNSYCIVFSFGYYQEILERLINSGFKRERITSLLDFFPNHPN